MVDDLNVGVRINEVDDHRRFRWLSAHAWPDFRLGMFKSDRGKSKTSKSIAISGVIESDSP